MSRPRILLADEHDAVARCLRMVLESGFDIIGTVKDGCALLMEAEKLQPDLIVTEITLPFISGIEAVRMIREASPAIRVVFLTMHTDAVYASQAVEAGGSAVVLKSSAGDELLPAIREVLAGGSFLSAAFANCVAPPVAGQPAPASL